MARLHASPEPSFEVQANVAAAVAWRGQETQHVCPNSFVSPPEGDIPSVAEISRMIPHSWDVSWLSQATKLQKHFDKTQAITSWRSPEEGSEWARIAPAAWNSSQWTYCMTMQWTVESGSPCNIQLKPRNFVKELLIPSTWRRSASSSSRRSPSTQ